MWLFVDLSSYLFVFGGDNKELNRLSCTVYHLIQHKTANIEGYISVNDFFPVLQDKVAG